MLKKSVLTMIVLLPLLASAQGSIQGLVRISGSNGNIISLSAGTPTSTFTLTLPSSLPASGSLLFGSATGQMQWNPTALTDAGYVLQLQNLAGVLTPKWIDPATLFNTSGFVNYNTTSAQATSVLRSNYLFNISYGGAADDANAVGARITSTSGSTNRNATGLTVSSMATGLGTATGLSVTAAGGVTNNAIDATGNLRLLATGGIASRLTLQNPAGTFTSSLVAGAQSANITYTLPTSAPAVDGYILQATTGGTMAWVDPSIAANGSYWTLSGNSTSSAWNGTTGSFIGTTSTQPLVIGTTNTTTTQPIKFYTGNVEHMRIDTAGNIGMGNTNPTMTLDITGAYGTRATTITLSNGVNNNIAIGNSSFVRIVGPTAAFTVTGIADGFDGKRVRIANITGKDWTIADSSSLSSVGNRIETNTNSDITIRGPVPVLEMIYDGATSQWLLGTLNANQVVGAVGSIIYARKTADESIINSATIQDDDHLSFAVNANETWEINGEIDAYCDDQSIGIKVALELPTSATMKVMYTGISNNGGNAIQGNDILSTSNTSQSVGITGGKSTLISFRGIVITNGTAGTVKFRWSPGKSDPTAVTVRSGSYMKILRVQ